MSTSPEESKVFQFDTTNHVVNDLGAQVGSMARDLAIARARIAELEAFIRENADTLGLETNEGGSADGRSRSAVVPDGVSGPGVADDRYTGQHAAS